MSFYPALLNFTRACFRQRNTPIDSCKNYGNICMRDFSSWETSKVSKLMIYFLGIQILLSLFAIHKDSNSILDFVGITLWCIWGNVLMFLVFKFNGREFKSIFNFTLISAFFASSFAIIIVLFLVSLIVLINGPLKESALIFITIPAVYLLFTVIGGVFGWIVFKYQTVEIPTT